MAGFELCSNRLSREFLIDFIHNTLSIEGREVKESDVIAVLSENDEAVEPKVKDLIINSFNGVNFILNLLENGAAAAQNCAARE